MSRAKIPADVKAWFQKKGSAGGKRAAANMTPEQRRARALKAVKAREAKRKRGAE